MPLGRETTERKLYDRLFGAVDRDFSEARSAGVPFLTFSLGGNVMVRQADPTAEP